MEDTSKFVEFRKLPATDNEARQGAVWDVWCLITLRSIGVIGWSGAFKTYSFASYHNVLLQPEHLTDIAEFIYEQNKERKQEHASTIIFGRR